MIGLPNQQVPTVASHDKDRSRSIQRLSPLCTLTRRPPSTTAESVWHEVCLCNSYVCVGRSCMSHQRLFCAFVIALVLAAVSVPGRIAADKSKDRKPSGEGTPVIWRDPGNIAEKDLYWGSGSEDHAPKPPFAFKSEDLKGT